MRFQFWTMSAARRPGGTPDFAGHVILLLTLLAIGKPRSGGQSLHWQFAVRTRQATIRRGVGRDPFPDTGGVPYGAHTHRMGDERGGWRARNAARVPGGRLGRDGGHRGSGARPSADSNHELTGHLRFRTKMFITDRRRTFGGNWLCADSILGRMDGPTGGGEGTGGAGHAQAHATRCREGNRGGGGTGGGAGRAQEAKPTRQVTRVHDPI